jgi:integrase
MKLRKYLKDGHTYWRADLGMVDGKRVQKQFPSRDAAQAWLSKEKKDVANHGGKVFVPPNERTEYLQARAKLAAIGATVMQAADYFIKHQPRKVRTLAEAIAECVIAKRTANKRARYIEGLEAYLNMFARGRGDVGIHTITSPDIETWFASRGEQNGTLASNLGRLSALFKFCVRRGYCEVNPCDTIERVHVDHGTPKILTVDECAKLLAACQSVRPDLLGYVALSLFAGVRPEEIGKLQWSDVDLDNKRVVIDEKIAKKRRRRITTLPDTAIAWLALCERKGGVAPWQRNTLGSIMRRTRKAAGVKWCQDILRHTAASHLMAKHQDAAFVANQLGNSPQILLTNYRALVTPQEDAKFWALLPETVASPVSTPSPPPDAALVP